MALKHDEIGYWSEVKLAILSEYARAYSKILSAQTRPQLDHFYIDGFSGAGEHLSKRTKTMVAGSPLNALHVEPPFKGYHLIDLDRDKTKRLRELVAGHNGVHVYDGDCNEILVKSVLPTITWGQYRRGLCVLDPYGLHLNWEVMRMAGQSGAIDMFLNFPVMDMNMNILWQGEANPAEAQVQRMNAFWGDDSWRNIAYFRPTLLFENMDIHDKASNNAVAEGFRRRLKEVAGFAEVPEPLPMTNSKGLIVYYLFFASQKSVAKDVVEDIFKKYKPRLANPPSAANGAGAQAGSSVTEAGPGALFAPGAPADATDVAGARCRKCDSVDGVSEVLMPDGIRQHMCAKCRPK